ncbi:hypothetical protein DENSPDRAFT_885766 [Dentipellis sp. KUC8613]|nr:hypothetical protein DENSPDRAFT_885766 [Dentipellis sp. KUC8613]
MSTTSRVSTTLNQTNRSLVPYTGTPAPSRDPSPAPSLQYPSTPVPPTFPSITAIHRIIDDPNPSQEDRDTAIRWLFYQGSLATRTRLEEQAAFLILERSGSFRDGTKWQPIARPIARANDWVEHARVTAERQAEQDAEMRDADAIEQQNETTPPPRGAWQAFRELEYGSEDSKDKESEEGDHQENTIPIPVPPPHAPHPLALLQQENRDTKFDGDLLTCPTLRRAVNALVKRFKGRQTADGARAEDVWDSYAESHRSMRAMEETIVDAFDRYGEIEHQRWTAEHDFEQLGMGDYLRGLEQRARVARGGLKAAVDNTRIRPQGDSEGESSDAEDGPPPFKKPRKDTPYPSAIAPTPGRYRGHLMRGLHETAPGQDAGPWKGKPKNWGPKPPSDVPDDWSGSDIPNNVNEWAAIIDKHDEARKEARKAWTEKHLKELEKMETDLDKMKKQWQEGDTQD